MKRKLILIAVIIASVIVTAIIITACSSNTTTAISNTCISCHTDEALLQQLTASIQPPLKSALISGEC